MTDERMVLIELIEKQADSDFVRDMLAFAADRIMHVKVEARTGGAIARPPWESADAVTIRDVPILIYAL
jgi:putative transposase